MVTGNVNGVSIRRLQIKGDQDHVSLCWQNMESLEDSRATESSVSNANLSNNGKRVEGAYGKPAEAGCARARLLAWFQNMVSGFSAPIPARTSLQRMRTSTK